MLGNGRLEAMCFDGTKRLCHIRGKLRKKVGASWPSHVWEALRCAEWAFPRWWGSEGSAPTDLCPICLPCRCGLTSQTSSWWDSEITRSVARAHMRKSRTAFAGVSTKEIFAFAGHQSRRHPEVQHRRGAQLESLRRAARQRCAHTPALFRPLTPPLLPFLITGGHDFWPLVSTSTAKINEDNFGPEDDDIQFDDCGYGDDDDVDEVRSSHPWWLIPSEELSSSCLCFLCLQIWRPATRGDAGILPEMLQLGYFELTRRTDNEYFLMKSADLIQFINTPWIYSSWKRVTSLLCKVNFTWREMDASTLSGWSHSLGGSWIGQLIGELPALSNLDLCLLHCGAPSVSCVSFFVTHAIITEVYLTTNAATFKKCIYIHFTLSGI